MTETPKEKTYYPLLLDLEGKRCLIVGGGAVAERRAAGLLEAGAAVTVVSRRLTAQLAAWAGEGRVRAMTRPYAEGLAELAEAALVFAATDRADVNLRVRAEAKALGLWVNVASDGEGGDFIVPAVVRRGRLTLAVSTGGASPALAARLRRRLAEQFGEDYAPHLERLHTLRSALRQASAEAGQRQAMLRELAAWEALPPGSAGADAAEFDAAAEALRAAASPDETAAAWERLRALLRQGAAPEAGDDGGESAASQAGDQTGDSRS